MFISKRLICVPMLTRAFLFILGYISYIIKMFTIIFERLYMTRLIFKSDFVIIAKGRAIESMRHQFERRNNEGSDRFTCVPFIAAYVPIAFRTHHAYLRRYHYKNSFIYFKRKIHSHHFLSEQILLVVDCY